MHWFTDEVRRTWNKAGLDDKGRLASASMGLAGEAGEVVDEVKKFLFHNKPLSENIWMEIGDVQYYLHALIDELNTATGKDMTMEDCLLLVTDKLRKRHPDGYSTAHYTKGNTDERLGQGANKEEDGR